MELILAFVAGGICGWVVGRVTVSRQNGEARVFRPNRRQRKILATLPPDPIRPSIEALVLEEAQELGVDRIPGAEAVPLGIRLKVWKRDHETAGPCLEDQWRFVVTPPPAGERLTAEHVRLECGSSDGGAVP